MLDLAWSLAGFIVALGVLVCFHEFGHYWAARRLGVKVLRFSLGWGKPWKSFRTRDGVEWALAPYPIGGYVKMLDEREAPVPAAERHLAFNTQTVPVRMAILVAGPLANFLLAVALYWVILVLGVPGLKPLVAEPRSDTPAAAAGLRAQDEILSVQGRPVVTWNDLRVDLLDHGLSASALALHVRGADGVERRLSLPMDAVRSDPQHLFQDIGLDVWQPRIAPVIGHVQPGSAAAAAGLRENDRVLAVEGQPVDDWTTLVERVRARPGEFVRLQVSRDGQTRELTAVLATHEEGGVRIGRLGAAPVADPDLWQNLRAVHRLDPIEAVPAAIGQTWQMTQLTLRMLWHMVLGEVSVKNVSGPIQIAQVAGDSAQIGLISFLSFMAVVSVSLGVLNLLPVPLLDGGHLLMFAIEGIKGRPLSERAQIASQYVGLAFIGTLMVLALFNDIMRLV